MWMNDSECLNIQFKINMQWVVHSVSNNNDKKKIKMNWLPKQKRSSLTKTSWNRRAKIILENDAGNEWKKTVTF